MLYSFFYKFFGLSFWEENTETQLINRLKNSEIQGISISKNNTISIPIENIKNSPKIKMLKERLLSRFKE